MKTKEFAKNFTEVAKISTLNEIQFFRKKKITAKISIKLVYITLNYFHWTHRYVHMPVIFGRIKQLLKKKLWKLSKSVVLQ